MVHKLLGKYRSIPQQAKASLWFVICGFLQKAISLLTTPIFSRLLTTEEYGGFNVFTTWESIIIILASLNLASGVYLRGLVKFENDNDEFTASLHSLYLLNACIVFVIYLVFSDFWNTIFKLPTLYVVLMFVDVFVVVAFYFWSARQRVNFLYRKLVFVTITNAIVKPVSGIIGILVSSDHLFARIITMVGADVLVFGYFFLAVFFKKGKIISTKYWKYALAYNLPLIPHYLSQIVLNQSDRLMINSMVGAGAAGIYSLAYNAAAIMIIINQSILNSYNPWMYKKIKEGQYERIRTVSLQLLVIVGGVNLLLIVLAPEAIAILAPASYYDAIWVVPPVSMSVFFMFMYSLFSNFEFYYEKTKIMMIASVAGAALNILLNYIFIEKYGYLAAGYTTLVCYLCYCVAHYLAMNYILKKELKGMKIYNMRLIALVSLIFVIIGFGMMFMYNHRVIRLSFVGVGVIFMYLFRNKLQRIIMTINQLKAE